VAAQTTTTASAMANADVPPVHRVTADENLSRP
jgi:hypothetical protein